MSELYCKGLSRESVVWGVVREGIKGSAGAEVGGVRNARQNRVSSDNHNSHMCVTCNHLYQGLVTPILQQVLSSNIQLPLQMAWVACGLIYASLLKQTK